MFLKIRRCFFKTAPNEMEKQFDAESDQSSNDTFAFICFNIRLIVWAHVCAKISAFTLLYQIRKN